MRPGVQSLSWKEPLEEGMATHSSILACRFPWTEEPVGPQSMGSQRVVTEHASMQWRTGGGSHAEGEGDQITKPLFGGRE